MIVSGLLLQVKKDWNWIQPKTQRAKPYELRLDFDDILYKARSQATNGVVNTWQDISRLDVRPSRGVIKVRLEDGWELQLDASTGELLQEAYRRSDLIEAIHDGSFFHDQARLGVFLPAAILLLFLWCSGLVMFSVQSYNRIATEKLKNSFQLIG